ncbi:MAG: hypothetical protein ACJAU9_001347 [Lentimonas sp.]
MGNRETGKRATETSQSQTLDPPFRFGVSHLGHVAFK